MTNYIVKQMHIRVCSILLMPRRQLMAQNTQATVHDMKVSLTAITISHDTD